MMPRPERARRFEEEQPAAPQVQAAEPADQDRRSAEEPQVSQPERPAEPPEGGPPPHAARVPPARREGTPPPLRHADFATWQPPEEEGDDEPIFGESPDTREHGPRQEPAKPERERASDADFVEVFLNVGRRDGLRAGDLQKFLLERVGLDRDGVRRIRVRERNAFVNVHKDDLQRVIAGLTGIPMGGRLTVAELARDRPAVPGTLGDDPVGAES